MRFVVQHLQQQWRQKQGPQKPVLRIAVGGKASVWSGVWAVMLVLGGAGWAHAAEVDTPVDTQEAPAQLSIPSGKYGLDKTHGYITFSYSHLGFSNPEVGFNEFDVDLTLDAETISASTFTVTIAADSIDSRVAEFDRHLKGADYFDVENHKDIVFVSESLTMTSATTADIAGNLSIRGVSHPITLNAVLNKAGMHPLLRVPALGVSASAVISRSKWGLTKYVPMVSDAVELRIEVELPQAKSG